MTFRFAPDGKFVNKFADRLMTEAILTGNQNRLYILTCNEIAVFSNTGAVRKQTAKEFANSSRL